MPVNTDVNNPNRERRTDYPNIIAKLDDIQQQINGIQIQLNAHDAHLEKYTESVAQIYELWVHSRWLIGTLKYLAALAAVLAAGWLSLKQLVGGLH